MSTARDPLKVIYGRLIKAAANVLKQRTWGEKQDKRQSLVQDEALSLLALELRSIADAIVSLAQPGEGALTVERAWLIERKASRFGPAAWWAGCGPLFDLDNERCWTQDSNIAIKFSDASSARNALWTLLRMAHQTSRDARVHVTEHMWPDITIPQAGDSNG